MSNASVNLVRYGLVTLVVMSVLGVYTSVLGAATATTWSGVTGATISAVDEPEMVWKNWYQPHCTLTRAVVVDYSERGEKDICVVSSDHVKLARYQVGSGGSNNTLYALQRDTDQEYHRIGSLVDLANLTLLDSDTILGASLSGGGLALYMMDNFQDRFTEEYISVGRGVVHKVYNLNMATARYFSDATGRRIPVQAIAVSNNNTYAAVRVAGRGIARIHLATGQVKLIADDIAPYPNTAVAISDDGNTIAVTGNRQAPHKVYTDIDECGAGDIYTQLVDAQICPFASFSTEIVPLLVSSTLYNLEVDTTSLSAHLWDESRQTSRKLTLLPDPNSYRLDYLALGDSYSSGEGDTEKDAAGQSYYLAGTDSPPNTCHISSRSYPFLLRNTWSLDAARMRSVACSGAEVVYDYSASPTSYLGQNQRLSGRSDIASARATALSQFVPGHVPQVEFVKKYQPRVLTLTGGGNDVGFADILSYCATPYWEDVIPVFSDCGYARQGSQMEQMLYDSIDTQYIYSKSMIQALKNASPATKIVVVGYPSFISDHSATGCALNSGSLTRAEIQMMNRMVDRMNTMLGGLARDTRVNFVDITDSLEGGRICEGSEYVSGVWGNATDQLRKTAMFHPNAKGHQRIAQAIAEKYSFNTLTIPSQSTYNGIASVATTAFELVQSGVSYLEGMLHIQTSPGTFAANSQYSVKIYSNPVELGRFTAKSDGSLEQAISLQGVAIGRHVLVVEGTAPNGTPKRLYQFVEVRATAGDADGDGVKDDADPCQFISSWIDEQTGEDICSTLTAPDAPVIPALPDSREPRQGTLTLMSDSVLSVASPVSGSTDTSGTSSTYTDATEVLGRDWSVAANLPTNARDTAQARSTGNTYVVWLGAACVIIGGIIWWRIHARSASE